MHFVFAFAPPHCIIQVNLTNKNGHMQQILGPPVLITEQENLGGALAVLITEQGNLGGP